MGTYTTHLKRLIRAPRAEIYKALVDAGLVAQWKVPDGMTMQVHEFDGREGGAFRISLTYTDAAGAGKTSEHTDTYHGHFVRLVPDKMVVEEDEFETSDPSLQGKMKATITLTDADGGTMVETTHEGVPAGLAPDANEEGWQMALDKLARLLESAHERKNGA